MTATPKTGATVEVRNKHFLRGAIQDSGLTHRELETRTGVDDTTISLLVNGRRNRLARDKAEAFCQALGVPLDLLFRFDIADATPASAS